MSESDLDYRIELGIEVLDSLIKYNDNRLSLTAERLGSKFSLIKFIKSVYYTWKISKFEVEARELQSHLKEADNFTDKHNLICEVNDFLEMEKAMLVKYIALTNLYPGEEPETIFNVLTYGGKI